MRTIKEIIVANLLKAIDEEENKLHEDDVEGHLWWEKFRQFIKKQEI